MHPPQSNTKRLQFANEPAPQLCPCVLHPITLARVCCAQSASTCMSHYKTFPANHACAACPGSCMSQALHARTRRVRGSSTVSTVARSDLSRPRAAPPASCARALPRTAVATDASIAKSPPSTASVSSLRSGARLMRPSMPCRARARAAEHERAKQKLHSGARPSVPSPMRKGRAQVRPSSQANPSARPMRPYSALPDPQAYTSIAGSPLGQPTPRHADAAPTVLHQVRVRLEGKPSRLTQLSLPAGCMPLLASGRFLSLAGSTSVVRNTSDQRSQAKQSAPAKGHTSSAGVSHPVDTPS